MRKPGIGFICWLVFMILAGMLPGQGAGRQTRGQGIKIKNEAGSEMMLYTESHALVIGVSEYQRGNGWPSLPGVPEDVKTVKSALEGQGFQVQVATNPTGKLLREAIATFIDEWGFASNNRLLLYFAGHGHTGKAVDDREMGYLVPADAPSPEANPAQFNRVAVSMREIIGYAERIQSKHALFVFDSCFSGTLFKTRDRVSPAIASKTAQPVRQFITAGTGTQSVPDQSQFRRQFLEALKGAADSNQDGYVTGSELGMYLEDKVTDYSNRAQTPQWGKINNPDLNQGDFVFVVAKTSESGGNRRVNPETVEMEFWERVKNSSNRRDLELYLTEYPKGLYAPLAKLRLAELERPAPPALAKQMTNRLGMEFVLIPAGRFQMGCSQTEAEQAYRKFSVVFKDAKLEWFTDAVPAHEVSITKPFYLGKYEVTQGQWEAVMGSNPSNFKGANLPVERVSWEDCQEFIRKLNAKGEGEYRLPSEAEWEYACRAGTTGEYAGSLDGMGWYYENSGERRLSDENWPKESDTNKCRTHPVGQKSPNAWGIYDMHGNVWEWCQDWYDEKYYGKSPGSDPTGPSGGTSRVIRGGGWNDAAPGCRSAYRTRLTPDARNYLLGFRLVRTAR